MTNHNKRKYLYLGQIMFQKQILNKLDRKRILDYQNDYKKLACTFMSISFLIIFGLGVLWIKNTVSYFIIFKSNTYSILICDFTYT